jgi:hypothetical protein
MRCHKDKSRTCGNGWRNSVFSFKLPKNKKVEKVVAKSEMLMEFEEGKVI